MNKIIAVIGMCGSGKSEAVKFFEKNGYNKVYFGGVVLDELKKRRLEVNEANERLVREHLRKEYGMGAMALKSINRIDESFITGNVVIESLYSWEEFRIIKNKYSDAFKLLAVYTTKALRYERLEKRYFRPLTHEQALSRDYAELENLDKGAPIAFADYTVINDGTLDELHQALNKFL